jgi:hypothetical protein
VDSTLAPGSPDTDLTAAVCPAGVQLIDSASNKPAGAAAAMALTLNFKQTIARCVIPKPPQRGNAPTCHDTLESKYRAVCGWTMFPALNVRVGRHKGRHFFGAL